MPNKVSVDGLYGAIKEYLNEYVEDIQDTVVENTDKCTKEAIKELKQNSPTRNSNRATPYNKGWTSKVQRKGKLKYSKVIYNKTNYQLTHLLEFGHRTSNNKKTRAIEHIRPIEKKYNQKFTDLIEKNIRRK